MPGSRMKLKDVLSLWDRDLRVLPKVCGFSLVSVHFKYVHFFIA